MAKKFRAHLDILPPAQRRLWGELGSVPGQFVLYGGTALALHLGHRESEDFDFFADRGINGDDLYRMTPFLQGSQITQLEPNTLTCLVERGGAVKVSFFGLPHLGRVRAPIIADNGIKIASLLDIAATKAVVVQQRAQAKDYIDIDALMTKADIDLPKQLAAARAVRGPAFAPTATLKALAHFEDGDLPTLPRAVRRRLARAAADVDPLRLPIFRRIATRGRKRG
jgi:hypothetical protein